MRGGCRIRTDRSWRQLWGQILGIYEQSIDLSGQFYRHQISKGKGGDQVVYRRRPYDNECLSALINEWRWLFERCTTGRNQTNPLPGLAGNGKALSIRMAHKKFVNGQAKPASIDCTPTILCIIIAVRVYRLLLLFHMRRRD